MTIEAKDKRYMITKNLFRAFLVCLLIFMSIAYTFIMFYRVNVQYTARLQETGDEIAKKIYFQMQSSIDYTKGMAQVFSNYEDIHDEEAIDTLVRVSGQSRFVRMWLTKVTGEAISSELIESNATGKPYLERGKNGESGLSEIQVSNVNGIRNVVAFSPIYYNENITGLVIGIYELDRLAEIIDINCFDRKGYCYLYTDDGEVIASSGIAPETNQLQEKYGYSSKVGDLNWNVFVTLPSEVIEGEIRENIILTVFMCGVYIVVLGIFFLDTYWSKNRELKRKAQIDSLTLLKNRGTIEKEINDSIEKMSQNGCAFILFDIDKFKGVNDSIGHISGDEVLRNVAQLMEREFKDIGLLGRLGGDEFVIFVKDVTDFEELTKIVYRFKDEVRDMKIVQGKEINISVSLGIAYSNNKLDNFNSLYKMADKLMYESKNKGGDAVSPNYNHHKKD